MQKILDREVILERTNREPEVARIRKKMRVLIRPYLVESMQ